MNVFDPKKYTDLTVVLTALGTTFLGCVGVGIFYSHIESEYGSLPARMEVVESSLADVKDQVNVISSTPSPETLRWEGEWSGKWSDTWAVTFDIFYTHDDKYLVVYYHQEDKSGPMLGPDISLGTVSGNTLNWGKDQIIQINSAISAEAIGVFDQGVARTATLTKVQG